MPSTEQRSTQRPQKPGSPARAVPALAGTEMWERFSFYGMQAIMVFYLYASVSDGGLGLDTTTATSLMGAYGALVYICTIVGGWFADRVIGAERTLLAGAVILVIGHLVLSVLPGGWGVGVGLPLVALGSGALKTSAITMLGRARDSGDHRRGADFQVFYLGINIGALLGPLLTGYLADTRGYRIAFAVAAALMIIGLIHYLLFRRPLLATYRADVREEISTAPAAVPGRQLRTITLTVIAMVATVVALTVTGVLPLQQLSTLMLVVTVAATVAMFGGMLRDPELDDTERGHVRSFIPLFIASAAFWAILNQTFGALAVYADVRVDRSTTLFGLDEIPAAWAQSLNPMFVLLLGLPLAALHLKAGSRVPAQATQITGGLALAGIGILLLVPFSATTAVPLAILVLTYLFITVGELHLSPTGMAASTTLAPARYRTRFSALFFMTMAVGTAAGGVLSTTYDPTNMDAERTYFLMLGMSAIVIAVICRLTVRR